MVSTLNDSSFITKTPISFELRRWNAIKTLLGSIVWVNVIKDLNPVNESKS